MTKRIRILRISGVCILVYWINYITRNMLSVTTPEMLKESFFTKEYTGLLSSVCFLFYAVGQLFNGIIGDRVRPRYMAGAGLLISSGCTVLIPLFENRILHLVCFSVIGYSLSMLRGPMVKVISENSETRVAQLTCTFFSMAGFVGSLLASLLSMFFNWRNVFFASAALSCTAAVVFFLNFLPLERSGVITFTPKTTTGFKCFAEIFRLKGFFFYMLISAITEEAFSSITFWIPTYATERLGLSQAGASMIYTLISVTGICAPFLSLFLYEKAVKNDVFLAGGMFTLSAFFFFLTFLFPTPTLNILFLILARLFAACASSIVWTVYIPGLAGSGNVSGANGVIDAAGYLFASVFNAIFAGAVGIVGWNGLILIWCGVMLIGALAALIRFLQLRKSSR